MYLKINPATILAAALLLTACAGPQTSVAVNARHVSSQIDKLHFDPNTRPLTADNIRLTAKFLSQFYELGKKDREAGLTLEQAQQRVREFGGEPQANDQPGSSHQGPFNSDAQKNTFITQQYSAEQPEKRTLILRNGATAVYWDGYNGRP